MAKKRIRKELKPKLIKAAQKKVSGTTDEMCLVFDPCPIPMECYAYNPSYVPPHYTCGAIEFSICPTPTQYF